MSEPLTYFTWKDEKVLEIETSFQESMDVLKWAFKTYSEKDIVYSCSFGAEGIVLIDMISKVKKDAKVIFLDTDLHFKETYKLIDQVKKRYPQLRIELIKPEMTLADQREAFGDDLWEHSPNKCCHIRKVTPLAKELAGISAWISGLRREQSVERSKTNYLNKDDNFESIKICPLIHWTWKEIWSYILLHQLDYNVLHDKGYPSIGCQKCTVPATEANNSRSGRWANLNKTECGLHSFNEERL